MTEKKEARTIKADKSLQLKIGVGPLDEKAVERCQVVMDNNEVDFTPLGMEYLTKLKKAIETTKTGELCKKKAVQTMTEPVMQLKANAATFRYTLISNLANVMLSFLEAVDEIDNDVIEIVDAHHKTLSAIVIKKMHGDGGETGKTMENELRAACNRYFAKKK